MLNDEICKLRERLDDSIKKGNNYEDIYNLSVQLDNLIAKYYIEQENIENRKL